jgi:hypothetical protein
MTLREIAKDVKDSLNTETYVIVWKNGKRWCADYIEKAENPENYEHINRNYKEYATHEYNTRYLHFTGEVTQSEVIKCDTFLKDRCFFHAPTVAEISEFLKEMFDPSDKLFRVELFDDNEDDRFEIITAKTSYEACDKAHEFDSDTCVVAEIFALDNDCHEIGNVDTVSGDLYLNIPESKPEATEVAEITENSVKSENKEELNALGEMRRLEYCTENDRLKKALNSLIFDKDLTRQDIFLILGTIRFSEGNEELSINETLRNLPRDTPLQEE